MSFDSAVADKVRRAKKELRCETAEVNRLEASFQALCEDATSRIGDAKKLIASLTNLVDASEAHVSISAVQLESKRVEAARELAQAEAQAQPAAQASPELAHLEHSLSLITNITKFNFLDDYLAIVSSPYSQSATTVHLDPTLTDFDQAQRLWQLIEDGDPRPNLPSYPR